MNATTGFIHKTLHRVLRYKRSVAYWQSKEKEMFSLRQEPQAKETSIPPYEGFLTGYETFVAQTLKSYTADLSPYAGTVDSEPLLRRCVSLMRRELNAEADRLCDAFRGHAGDEPAFRNRLREMAEAAVVQLTETIGCPEAHAV